MAVFADTTNIIHINSAADIFCRFRAIWRAHCQRQLGSSTGIYWLCLFVCFIFLASNKEIIICIIGIYT